MYNLLKMKPNMENSEELLEKLKYINDICNEGCHQIRQMLSEEDDIVIFLGNTRSGKSTVVNFVIGTPLRAIVSSSRKNCYDIVKNNINTEGPIIGRGSRSETTIPSSWTTNKISGKVVDAPGFDDNRGIEQDIVNAFFIKELIENAKSVKFILISDINDICTHNISQFTAFVGKISTMLPSSKSLHEGMALVLTKDKDEYSHNDIFSYFREKILEQTEMVIENRELIAYFASNLHKLGFFRMPVMEGCILDNIGEEIIDLIENKTKKLEKQLFSQIKPGISLHSRTFLLKARQSFTEKSDLDLILKFGEETFIDLIHDTDLDSIKTIEEVVEVKENIKTRAKKLKAFNDNYSSLEEMVDTLGSLDPSIMKKIEDLKFRERLRFIKFVDDILEVQQSKIFIVKIYGMFSTIKKTLAEICSRLDEKLMEFTIIQQKEAQKEAQELFRIEQQKFKDNIEAMTEKSEEEKLILMKTLEDTKIAFNLEQDAIQKRLEDMKISHDLAKLENEEQKRHYEQLLLDEKLETERMINKLEDKFESDFKKKEKDVDDLIKSMEEANDRQILALKEEAKKNSEEALIKQQQYIDSITEQLKKNQEAIRETEKSISDKAELNYETFMKSLKKIEDKNSATLKSLLDDQKKLTAANAVLGKSIAEKSKTIENSSQQSNQDLKSTLLSSVLPAIPVIAKIAQNFYEESAKRETTNKQLPAPINNSYPQIGGGIPTNQQCIPYDTQQQQWATPNFDNLDSLDNSSLTTFRTVTPPEPTKPSMFYSNLPFRENVATWKPSQNAPIRIYSARPNATGSNNYTTGSRYDEESGSESDCESE